MIMQFSTSFQLAVELTNRCNFSCVHCFRNNNCSGSPDFPLSFYEKILKEAHSYRARHIALTGGEPTLHPEFETILALTAEYDYSWILVTNGWTFESCYPLLLDYRDNLHAVAFSLDGAKEHTHDTIRRQSGSYKRVIEACMISYYKHIPFSLSMTIQRANVGEIDDLIELAAKLGAEEVNLASAQLTKKLVSQTLRYLLVSANICNIGSSRLRNHLRCRSMCSSICILKIRFSPVKPFVWPCFISITWGG